MLAFQYFFLYILIFKFKLNVTIPIENVKMNNKIKNKIIREQVELGFIEKFFSKNIFKVVRIYI